MVWVVVAFFAFTAFVIRDTTKNEPEFLKQESKWVDSVFNSLSPDERIGQLFMIAAYSNKDMKHVREVREQIEKYKIGGLIFMQGGPVREARLCNYYQGLSKTPLLISIDGEWGLAMRLDSTAKYPRQMTLGAIKNDSLIYYMGRQIARECKRMGIHVNFAPVADINNNPLNPVIGTRSFGENKYKVAQKAIMYMKGLQDEGVMANGKHFPGHGDTDSDSHQTLPIISACRERMDTLELYPFRQLFNEGLASIMVAHLFVPCYDTTKNTASTLSSYIVNDLLKKQMQFKGLVFTDALNMKGVSGYYEPGVINVKAILAGNDVLLFADDVGNGIAQIKAAIGRGEITQQDIDERCRKILKAKFWCGLSHKQVVYTKNLYEDLLSVESGKINTKLAEAAVTLLKNDHDLLPLKRLDTLRIADVVIGENSENDLTRTLRKYTGIRHFHIEHDAKQKDRDTLLARLKHYNLVVVQLNKTSYKPDRNFGISDGSQDLLEKIVVSKPSVVCLFSNPYVINKLSCLDKASALLELYENSPFLQKAAADAIIGAIAVNGTMPVSAGAYKQGFGLELARPVRLQYMDPALMGIDEKKLEQADSIARYGIREKAYPGCQVMAILNGKVFYRKNFGRYTYDPASEKVTDSTVYDLASLTKILASSLALMKLQQEKTFDYHRSLGYYFPELQGSNKYDLNYEDILTHQSGLQAWLPFWQKTLSRGNYKPGYYSAVPSPEFPTQVAHNLYVVKGFTDSIYRQIVDSKVDEKGKYVYSDIGYYFSKKLIEQKTSQPLNVYVKETFYKPMGLQLTYLPKESISVMRIAPTEYDTKFRKQVLIGYVHDQGAALMGGVGGHAGLFGNAADVGVIMQMLLDKGMYGGRRYLDSAVINDFTRAHFPDNRRGLCFDKPEPNDKKESPVTKECSLQSFGHSGFTGTFAWADPQNGLVFIFLSNRVFPSADENKLAKLGIRGKIHKVLYEAVSPVKP